MAPTVSIKSVKNIDEAIHHINKYGTMHTDCIITQNKKSAKKFLDEVKSSIAMHNTSTQFADGGEFGFGGEVGISTNILPPRGPVGLNQLVSYKYQVSSKGVIRNNLNLKKNKIGILGGSFDPAHKGHLAISKEAAKKFKLKKIIWAITKKNPFKKKSSLSLSTRIQYCKKITEKTNFIIVKFLENKIKSNKTIDLINFFAKNKKNEIFFLMGADNLINFHKWHKWKIISQKCNIIVFDRYGYKKRSLNSKSYKSLNKDKLKFINFNKVNISSSQLRKI